MFTIYRDFGRVPLGKADSLLGVVHFAESCGVGRYDVDEVGTVPRRWGEVIRNQDGTFILAPDRSGDWMRDLAGTARPS
jgi:hypothetical protein